MELHYLSAAEAIELFKKRRLSPVELMAAVIARAAQVEPQINAFSYRYFDEAWLPYHGLGWLMTYPFNMLSRCPVLNLPAGRASNGAPIGIQPVGPTYEDVKVFQAGAAYEKAVGPFIGAGSCPQL